MRRWFRRPADRPQAPARDESISAQGDISGIASTGDYVTNVQAKQATVLPAEVFRPVSEVAAPPGLMNLPVRPELFVGRDEAVADLRAALAAGSGVVVVAVVGLGGVGKSTLAARYAATCPGDHSVVWWITADTPAAIDTGLAALAVAMQPALSRALPLEALREWALQWLACHDEWLLVLDNVNDPADIAPLTGRVSTGRFLVTSRLAVGWHAVASSVVRLDVISTENAVVMLTRIAPGKADGAGELCAELGCLPLAIEQAGAYLAETAIGPRAYLALLAEYPAVMFESAAAAYDPERTIARIWRVTLDRLADDPLVGQVLRIVAWYAPDPFPRALLNALAAPPDLHHAIGQLAAYSMLTANDTTITVHRLVQSVARTPDAADPHRAAARIDEARTRATTLLDGAIPPAWADPAAWPTWRTLLPHIDALTDHAPADTDTATMAHLLNQSGLFFINQGAPARAIRFLHRSLTDRRRVLGEDHPDTLASRNNLAGAYQEVGDLGRAIPLLQHGLTECVRVLGKDHPDTLRSRNNLAGAYRDAGDLGQAISLYEQTLTDRRRVLGKDHPDTLTTRNNLAHAFQKAGDLGRAIPLYEQTLTDRRQVLGEDHPDTLTSRNNLISAYHEAGDLGRAIPLNEQTLTDSVRVLGEDHPETLRSRNNLAYAYQEAGDLGRAITLYQQALADCVRVLGEDHPTTLTSRNNLAGAYQLAGGLGRATALYEQTLTDQRRVLGEDHPDTLTSRSNLAYSYQAAGDLGRAIALYQQALTDCIRALGEDHPTTLTTRNNLAHAYQEAGDLGRAIPLYQQALTDCIRVLGEDHPTTLTTRNNLAHAYHKAGDLRRAIPLYQQALTDCIRVLGEDHPTTLTTRNNLAGAYRATGDLDRAIPLNEEALTDCIRVLGEDHPTTLTSRINLADTYMAAGDLDRAVPLNQEALADCIRVLGEDHPTTVLARRKLAAARQQRE